MQAYRSTLPGLPSLPDPGSGRFRSSDKAARRRPASRGGAIGPALRGLLGLLALITAAACSSEEAFLLLIRPPAGVAITQYEVTVQDRESRDIVYGSGIQSLPPSAQGRDLSVEPLRIGLKLAKKDGTYLVHIRATSTGMLSPKGVTPKPRLPELFFASIVRSSGTLEIDGALLEVQPANDKDFDHFPDKDSWIADNMAASLRYRNQRDVLDCIDSDPVPNAATLPRTIYAQQVNPLAKPLCGLPFDVSCDAMAPACKDQDGDGEPEITDCDDSDNKRFHGNARPRNCCQCTDRKSCETNHQKRADLSTCQPARCDDPFDYDCTGMVVPCFVDEDCDGYSPQDPVVSQRDCDDNNPDVHPGAPKNCADSSKDWACDGNPTGGCVPCDLDGDGFQRLDAAAKCPQAGYTKPLDCDDNDRGVFPGSTMTPGASIVIVNDLKGTEGGGSAIAAMRRLCANTAVSGGAQDADCGGGRAGCPPSPTTCDRDLDGFPNINNATCNPAGLPVDCNDTAPAGANLNGAMVFPGAPVRCAKDAADPLFGGQQENCSGNVRPLCMNDADGDGWDAMFDCDNADPNIHPWAAEVCDGKDNDCDGLIDEMNPDPSGNRMVETNMVGGSPVTSIKSCTDYNAGSCGQKVTATGGFSGRCVCTAIAGGANAGAGKYTACPGQPTDPKSTAVAPKCFGATQPAQQTCVAGQDTDEDCDGRTNAPDGANLKEYGEVCGVETGECVAGKVNGCVRPLNKAEDATKINKFSNLAQPDAYTVSPPFDNNRRYLTCDNTAVYPAKEVCDGVKDEDCNAKVDDCSEAGFGKPSCCAGINMCLDLNTNFDHCGTCTNACDSKTANKCAAASCQCGTNPACAGASPLCNTTTEQCVQCLADGDCMGIAGKPRCKDKNSCVQCLGDGDCMGATPGCNTINNTCVECTTNAHCAGVAGKPVCDTAANKCVACVGNGDCPMATPVCSMNQCYQCIANANCPMATPVCDMNACVECTVDANCTTAGKPHCANKKCVECTMNAQCPMAKPVCDNMNKCVECTMDNQCPTDKPKCNNSVCGCAMDADCPATKPYCNGMALCVECTMNAQCPMAKSVCSMDACVECIDDTTCGGGTPKCFNKTCVECNTNADCNGMKTCSAMHTCV